MSKVHKHSVPGVCTTAGAPGPAPPAPAPAHALAATVAHAGPLTPLVISEMCRAQEIDVAKALDRSTTPRSRQMRKQRRPSHDTRQKGRKGLEEARAYRGHSDGLREVPMVRAPADPLGSGTPSRGRSQRRDTGRGPVRRFMHISTHGSGSSKAFARLSRLSHASAPETTGDQLQELASAVSLVPVSSIGSKNSRIRKRLSTP